MNTPRTSVRSHVMAVLGLLCAVLVGCGGGGAPSQPDSRDLGARLTSASSAELVSQVRAVLQQRWALRQQPGATWIERGTALAPVLAGGDAALASVPSHSQTLVQEAGVDEPDLLKTDGRLLYLMDHYSAATDAPGKQRSILLRVAQPGSNGQVGERQSFALSAEDGYPVPRGLLLAANAARLVALTEQFQPVALPQPCPPGAACLATDLIWAPQALRSHVQLQVADQAADGSLSLSRRIDIEGRLVNARRVGDMVYLLTTHAPRLAADELPATASATEREAALAALSARDLLPRVRIDGGAWQALLQESDCLLQPANRSTALTLTTLVALDLSSPLPQRAARCFLGGTEALYLSPRHLYLATTRSAPPLTLPDGRQQYPDSFVTDIHRFAFDGLAIGYRGSGEVAGHLGWDPQRMALRLSEYQGDLRVLSFTGNLGWFGTPGAQVPAGSASPATLTVLREDPGTRDLRTLATLPNARRPAALGKPGEQLYGVRFDQARAYLVTFRQTDPLYVLDLSEPADPRTAGELQMPGFSDTLLPLGDGLLFGVGREATEAGLVQGIKLALFDVGDATQPRLLQTRVYGARGSSTALDVSTHGLNVHRSGSRLRLALPMSLRESDYSPQAEHGLFRFELDPLARSLVPRPTLLAPPSTDHWDLSGDRSLQIGDAVFYLTQGRLLGAPW
jgi:Beta propeller domain